MLRLAVTVLVLVCLFLADLIGDIGGFLTSPFRKVADLAKAVWKAFKRLYAWITSIFRNVGGAWNALHDAYHVLISGLERLAEGTYGTLRWIVKNATPKQIAAAVRKAASAVLNTAKGLVRTITKRIDKIVGWVRGAIGRVIDRITKSIRIVTKAINKAWNWITHAGKRIADLVLHPTRLVTWIMPSLVTPLARWILSHLESLATLMLRWLLSNIGRFARDIERAILKIF